MDFKDGATKAALSASLILSSCINPESPEAQDSVAIEFGTLYTTGTTIYFDPSEPIPEDDMLAELDPTDCAYTVPEYSETDGDTLLQELYVNTFGERSALSPNYNYDDTKNLREFLTEEYGLNFSFQSQDTTNEQTRSTTEAFKESGLETGYDKARAISATVDAIQLFHPNLIKALGLKEIVFTGPMYQEKEINGETIQVNQVGNYLSGGSTNYVKIRADIPNDDIAITIVHEIIHVIDAQVLCPEDTDEDPLFTYHHQFEYDPEIFLDPGVTISDRFLLPGPDRIFPNAYALTSVEEHRAEVAADMFFGRGLILEGDPDYESPLYFMQRELLRRLEITSPGIERTLLDQTLNARYIELILANRMPADTSELQQNIEANQNPDLKTTALAHIELILENEQEIEQLNGVVMEFRSPRTGQTRRAIENPLILRDSRGRITAIAWADESSHLNATYFDDALMYLRATQNPQSYSSNIGTLEAERLESNSNAITRLSVNGISPQVLRNTTTEELEEQYPVVLNPEDL